MNIKIHDDAIVRVEQPDGYKLNVTIAHLYAEAAVALRRDEALAVAATILTAALNLKED